MGWQTWTGGRPSAASSSGDGYELGTPPTTSTAPAKILIDSGKANDPAEAEQFLRQLVLQVAVGPSLEHDRAAQAALATVVNAGRRAFLGGVYVRLDTNPSLRTGWTVGTRRPPS